MKEVGAHVDTSIAGPSRPAGREAVARPSYPPPPGPRGLALAQCSTLWLDW